MALTAFTDCWTISGWCETRQALRNFRLDRIQKLRMTEDIFDHIPDHDIEAYVKRRRDILIYPQQGA